MSAGEAAANPLWEEHRLDDRAVLELQGARGAGTGSQPGAARILAGGGQWLLVAPPAAGIAVNGVATVTGICVLSDRDALHGADTEPIYFSTECPPAITGYPLDDASARCPRCQQPIELGSPSVACHCGAYYHQTDPLPCYTYGPCAVCGAAASLDGSYRWTPEYL
jgi:hypothetical protein